MPTEVKNMLLTIMSCTAIFAQIEKLTTFLLEGIYFLHAIKIAGD